MPLSTHDLSFAVRVGFQSFAQFVVATKLILFINDLLHFHIGNRHLPRIEPAPPSSCFNGPKRRGASLPTLCRQGGSANTSANRGKRELQMAARFAPHPSPLPACGERENRACGPLQFSARPIPSLLRNASRRVPQSPFSPPAGRRSRQGDEGRITAITPSLDGRSKPQSSAAPAPFPASAGHS